MSLIECQSQHQYKDCCDEGRQSQKLASSDSRWLAAVPRPDLTERTSCVVSERALGSLPYANIRVDNSKTIGTQKTLVRIGSKRALVPGYVVAGVGLNFQRPRHEALRRWATVIVSRTPYRTRLVIQQLGVRRTTSLETGRSRSCAGGWLGEYFSSALTPLFSHSLTSVPGARFYRSDRERQRRSLVRLGHCSASLGTNAQRSLTGPVAPYGPDHILEASVAQVTQKIRSGTWTATQIAERYLRRLKETEPLIHAYLHVDEQQVLAQAAVIDQKYQRGETLGALAGVPISVKDNLLTRMMPTTAGSRLLQGYQAPEDATCICRLRAADAIILGKTAMDEFGMGSSTENCAFGSVRNPRNLSLVPGGSSGGSAASVAAGSALLSLGSDTGGSIRQPAAFCGVVGLKPSYGRVSRYGLIAYASSLDTVGPIARSVVDLTRCLDVIAGPDSRDLTSLSGSVRFAELLEGQERATLAEDKPLKRLRVGVWSEALEMPQLASAGRAALEAAIETITSLGASIIPISMPRLQDACAAYYILASSEASANLARYDGVRYGARAVSAQTAAEMTRQTRTLGLGAEVKRRIMLGTFALSAGYVDAYYRRATQVRQLVKRDFEHAFEQCDYLVSPVSPAGAFALGTKAGVDLYAEDVLTVPASLAGLPALSLPCRLEGPLPTGMQITGRYADDLGVLRLGMVYERATRLEISADDA
jgi:aspartyl-tRNA(Asn)/glutamyl-tRNA(Gln) amidotransferase subunit A